MKRSSLKLLLRNSISKVQQSTTIPLTAAPRIPRLEVRNDGIETLCSLYLASRSIRRSATCEFGCIADRIAALPRCFSFLLPLIIAVIRSHSFVRQGIWLAAVCVRFLSVFCDGHVRKGLLGCATIDAQSRAERFVWMTRWVSAISTVLGSLLASGSAGRHGCDIRYSKSPKHLKLLYSQRLNTPPFCGCHRIIPDRTICLLRHQRPRLRRPQIPNARQIHNPWRCASLNLLAARWYRLRQFSNRPAFPTSPGVNRAKFARLTFRLFITSTVAGDG